MLLIPFVPDRNSASFPFLVHLFWFMFLAKSRIHYMNRIHLQHAGNRCVIVSEPKCIEMIQENIIHTTTVQSRGNRKSKTRWELGYTTFTGNSFRMQWSARARLLGFNVWTVRGNVRALDQNKIPPMTFKWKTKSGAIFHFYNNQNDSSTKW